MAKMIVGINPLREKYTKYRNIFIVASICFCFLLFFVHFFIAFPFGIVAGLVGSKYFALKAAIDGEKALQKKVYSLLPDTYTVITNVELTSENKTIYLDQIIVGPAGVYLVEVKNMNGHVVGDADHYELIQHKTGRRGGQYSKTIKNPIKQLSRQIYHLSNFLKYYGCSVWVNGIVVFSNNDVKVRIVGSKYPIFLLSVSKSSLRDYLLRMESSQPNLKLEDQQKVIELLTGAKTN